jgi:hypothetical protein
MAGGCEDIIVRRDADREIAFADKTDGPLHRRGDYINSRRPSLLRPGALTIARPSVLSQRRFKLSQSGRFQP